VDLGEFFNLGKETMKMMRRWWLFIPILGFLVFNIETI